MKNNNLKKYTNEILASEKGHPFAKELLINSEKEIDVYYSPFESINLGAKICIVGISPGPTQADAANTTARDSLKKGLSVDRASEKAKVEASFSGALRNNLIKLLDYTGVSRFLGLTSSKTLFSSDANLLHCTSVFRYPTLHNGQAIPTAKKLFQSQLLMEMVDTCLVDELQQLASDVLYIPLGSGVADVLKYLAEKGVIKQQQILTHLPHPSGANAERIAYFLEKKDSRTLSAKTNAEKIDSAKRQLFEQLNSLGIDTPPLGVPKNLNAISKLQKSTRSLVPQSKQQIKSDSSTQQSYMDMTSQSDGFILDSVEHEITKTLNDIALFTIPGKSRTSKEIAVTKNEKIVAYISRKTGLKKGYMTVAFHPSLQGKLDQLSENLQEVSISSGRHSRLISSSNYRGFDSKGYSNELQSNEHQAVAYKVDVSKGLGSLKSLFSTI